MSNLSAEDSATLVGIIEASNLVGVQFYEYSATRHGPKPEAEEEREIQLEVQTRRADGEFGVRLIGVTHNSEGEVRVSVAAEYEAPSLGVIPDRDVSMFANEVAVMTLFPYLREAVQTLSTRLFHEGWMLPILERGQLASAEDGTANN